MHNAMLAALRRKTDKRGPTDVTKKVMKCSKSLNVRRRGSKYTVRPSEYLPLGIGRDITGRDPANGAVPIGDQAMTCMRQGSLLRNLDRPRSPWYEC